MADNTVKFTITIDGNAYSGVARLDDAVHKLNDSVGKSQSMFTRFGEFAYRLNNIMQLVGNTIGRVVGKLQEFEQAGRAQAEAETKLAQVMRNTMGEDIARRHDRVSTALKQEREAVEVLCPIIIRYDNLGLLRG